MTAARVAAIIVNHDGAGHLLACIDSLRAQSEPVDIVVVDNASQDDSLALLGNEPEILVVANRTNRGYAGGANDGLSATKHPVVLVANPDTRFAPDHVARVLEVMDRDERVGSVQGRLLRFDGDDLPAVHEAVLDSCGHAIDRSRLFRNLGAGEPAWRWDTPAEVFGVTGAAAFHRRVMLEDIAIEKPDGSLEVFDETLFAFFEDVDLDWRARLRGWTARYEPAAVGWHERGGRGTRRSRLVEELNFANRLLVVAKHDVWSPTSWPVMALATLAKAALVGPRVLWACLRRLRTGWPDVRRDRRWIRARAVVAPRKVVTQWVEPVSLAGRRWRR
ncbi:MAG TPA: glycosyltransferase family 2 protein [Nitriliruptorales bacterium]